MRKFLILIFSIVMIFSFSSFMCCEATSIEGNIKVVLKNYTGSNGRRIVNKEVIFDVEPQIVNGRTMVPIRAVAEELDWDVEWNSKSNSVILKNDISMPGGRIQKEVMQELFQKLSDNLIFEKNTEKLSNWEFLEHSNVIENSSVLEPFRPNNQSIFFGEQKDEVVIKIDIKKSYLELTFNGRESYIQHYKGVNKQIVFHNSCSFETYVIEWMYPLLL